MPPCRAWGAKKKSVPFFRIYFGGLWTWVIFSHHKQVHIFWIKKLSAKNIDFKNFHAQDHIWVFPNFRENCCQNTSKIGPNIVWLIPVAIFISWIVSTQYFRCFPYTIDVMNMTFATIVHFVATLATSHWNYTNGCCKIMVWSV